MIKMMDVEMKPRLHLETKENYKVGDYLKGEFVLCVKSVSGDDDGSYSVCFEVDNDPKLTKTTATKDDGKPKNMSADDEVEKGLKKSEGDDEENNEGDNEEYDKE